MRSQLTFIACKVRPRKPIISKDMAYNQTYGCTYLYIVLIIFVEIHNIL